MWWMVVGAASAQVTIESTGAVHATIGAAIAAASAGDVLLLTPGTYTEAVVIDRPLTIDGGGATSWLANGVGDAVVDVALGVDLVLRNVSIVPTARRAVIARGGNALLFDGVALIGHATTDGGGLAAYDPASVTLVNTSFITTSSDGSGGGLFVTSIAGAPVTVSDGLFVDTASYGLAGGGGAIAVQGVTLLVERTTFVRPFAENVGAIFDLGGSDVVVVDSRFDQPSATLDVAGVGGQASSSLRVEGNVFCAPSAGRFGGAIGGDVLGDAVVRNNLFDGADALVGAGVFAAGGVWEVANNTFLASAGGSAVTVLTPASANLVGSVFTGSVGTAIDFPDGAVATGVAYNLFWANALDTFGVTAGLGTVFADPMLAFDPTNYGCGAPILPIAGSPVIDGGDPGVVDPDLSRSDIGVFGGPEAELWAHDDVDGDSVAEAMGDCSDADPNRQPLATEVCNGIDDDCDLLVDDAAVGAPSWSEDADGDGQGAGPVVVACDPPAANWVTNGTDCDDLDPLTYTGAPEICAAGDQNCDGHPDLGAIDAGSWLLDADLDGWGTVPVPSCSPFPTSGTTSLGGDCNDGDATIWPGAPDPCGDEIDGDCSGADGASFDLVAWYADADSDTYGDPNVVVYDCEDLGAAGTHTTNAIDCDDTNPSIHPGVGEVCNGVDDDCSGVADDGLALADYWYDGDNDGIGVGAPTLAACAPTPDWVTTDGDCDDTDAAVYPGAPERCNDTDDDCDGLSDIDDPDSPSVEVWPDADGDGFGACADSSSCPSEWRCSEAAGWADNAIDCDDADPTVNPAAEEMPGNAIDEDCDGSAPGASDPVVSTEPEPAGCACASADGRSAHIAPLLLLAMLGLQRRRSVRHSSAASASSGAARSTRSVRGRIALVARAL